MLWDGMRVTRLAEILVEQDYSMAPFTLYLSHRDTLEMQSRSLSSSLVMLGRPVLYWQNKGRTY